MLRVSEAEEKALEIYNWWLGRMRNTWETNNPGNTTRRTEVDLVESALQQYTDMSQRYCSALHGCYPMFANHHMENSVRSDMNCGGFYCPLSVRGKLWYRKTCRGQWAVDVWFEVQKIGNMYRDFNHRTCNKEYDNLNSLLTHLEGMPGPMHKAAATYMRFVYYNPKTPIQPGVFAYDVDNKKYVIKAKNGGEDIVVLKEEPPGDKPEDFYPSEESDDDTGGETGSDDRKPAAKKTKTESYNWQDDDESSDGDEECDQDSCHDAPLPEKYKTIVSSDEETDNNGDDGNLVTVVKK